MALSAAMLRALLLLQTVAIVSSTLLAPHSRPALLRRQSQAWSNTRSLLVLRGGADSDAAAAEDSSSSETEAPLSLAEDDDAVPTSALDGCWAGVLKLLGMLRSLLSPTYEYSKRGADLLGDSSQMCAEGVDAPPAQSCKQRTPY